MSTPSTTRRPPNFLTSSVALSARSCDRKRLHCRSPARMNSGAERVRESENRTHRELVAVRRVPRQPVRIALEGTGPRSEEQTSELQSLMRISYAVFCLKKKK